MLFRVSSEDLSKIYLANRACVRLAHASDGIQQPLAFLFFHYLALSFQPLFYRECFDRVPVRLLCQPKSVFVYLGEPGLLKPSRPEFPSRSIHVSLRGESTPPTPRSNQNIMIQTDTPNSAERFPNDQKNANAAPATRTKESGIKPDRLKTAAAPVYWLYGEEVEFPVEFPSAEEEDADAEAVVASVLTAALAAAPPLDVEGEGVAATAAGWYGAAEAAVG